MDIIYVSGWKILTLILGRMGGDKDCIDLYQDRDHVNEHSGSSKFEEVLEHLHNLLLLRTDPAPCS
jgi:hypothetical protein